MELIALFGIVFASLGLIGGWTAILAFVALMVILEETERWGWGTFVLLIVASAFVYRHGHWYWPNPIQVLRYAACYVGVGVLWGIWKWYWFCRAKLSDYNRAKQIFLKSRGAQEMTAELKVEWTKQRERLSTPDSPNIPQASDYKEKILNWMYLWPFSVIGTVLSDWARRLFVEIYERLSRTYDAIARSVWKGVEQDFASKEELAAHEAANDAEFQKRAKAAADRAWK